MYMSTYNGRQSRTFGAHEMIEAAKQDAERHAQENGRIHGYYLVVAGDVEFGGFFLTQLGADTIKGEKRGKTIQWAS